VVSRNILLIRDLDGVRQPQPDLAIAARPRIETAGPATVEQAVCKTADLLPERGYPALRRPAVVRPPEFLGAGIVPKPRRSRPALNPRPAPLSTTTRQVRSADRSRR
jgi:hypothetical protein